MRDSIDVRDLRGRLYRVLAAIPLGIASSLAVTYALPTRRHFDGWGCMSSEGGWFVVGGSPTLILVGAIVATLAWTAALGCLHRAWQARSLEPLVALPVARVLRRRPH